MNIFLDSCVILSKLPRELLFELARRGVVALNYSQSVEDESLFVAKRNGIEADIVGAFVSLRLIANKSEPEKHDGLWLPDENDRHVVLGALGAKAEIIATENLRDFPKSALMPIGLSAQSPDEILGECYNYNNLPDWARDVKALKRAKLYRLGKLVKKELDK